jgi:diguanylate cyclase (GGDEF)-like protein
VADKRKCSAALVCSTLGVAAIILILTSIWFVHQGHLNDLRHTIKNGQLAAEKMELIASLIEIARARTRLTNKMTFLEDIFEKDEINLQLDRHASEFAVLRQQLLGLPNTRQELNILESQRNVIKPALYQQRLAAELAMSDDPEEVNQAKSVLIEQVYPNQGKIIDHFMRLLNLQKQKINMATLAANQQFENNRRLEILLFALISALVVIIAFISIKRLSRTDTLEHEASHDELTGLLNRREFERQVTQILETCSGCEGYAFGLVDLDNFKRVNDCSGHAAGDALLRKLSQHVKEKLRRRDLLARIGGDEFAFFLVDINARDIEKITNHILEAVESVVLEWDGNSHRAGASVGVVPVSAENPISYKTQYKCADNACYQAKANGKNNAVIWSESHSIPRQCSAAS